MIQYGLDTKGGDLMATTNEISSYYPNTIINMYLNQLPGLPAVVIEDLDTNVEFAKKHFPDHIFERRAVELKKGAEASFNEKGHLKHCDACRTAAGC